MMRRNRRRRIERLATISLSATGQTEEQQAASDVGQLFDDCGDFLGFSLDLGFLHQQAQLVQPGHRTTRSCSQPVGVTEDAPDVQLTLRSPIRLF